MTTSTPLPKRQSMRVLLAGILLFHVGWYMLLPYLAVLFTTRRGFGPAEVGFVLAGQSFAVLFGSIWGGQLADRYGRKTTLLAGLVLRTVGLIALGYTTWLQTSLLAAMIAGFGGGLFSPAAKAGLAVLAGDEDRTQVFSWRGIAANVGTSLGPLLGLLFLRGSLPLLFWVAALIHVGLAVAIAIWLVDEPAVNITTRSPYRDTVADWPFFLFSLVTVLAWALFAQLAIAMPLYARQVLGLEATIGLIWTISSLVVIVGQLGVSKYVLQRIHPTTAMAAGSLFLGTGLGLIYFAHSFAGLLGAVLVFVLGEMLIVPTFDASVSQMARAGAIGSYFGIASFAWGLGEGAGNLAGGGLMQLAFSRGLLYLPWLTYAASGVAVAALYIGLRYFTPVGRRLSHAKATRPQQFRAGFPAAEEAILLGPKDHAEEE